MSASLSLPVDDYYDLPESIRADLDEWLTEVGVLHDPDGQHWLVGITLGEGFVDTIEEVIGSGERITARIPIAVPPPRHVVTALLRRFVP